MSDSKGYYKILGLQKNCNQKDIKKKLSKIGITISPR